MRSPRVRRPTVRCGVGATVRLCIRRRGRGRRPRRQQRRRRNRGRGTDRELELLHGRRRCNSRARSNVNGATVTRHHSLATSRRTRRRTATNSAPLDAGSASRAPRNFARDQCGYGDCSGVLRASRFNPSHCNVAARFPRALDRARPRPRLVLPRSAPESRRGGDADRFSCGCRSRTAPRRSSRRRLRLRRRRRLRNMADGASAVAARHDPRTRVAPCTAPLRWGAAEAGRRHGIGDRSGVRERCVTLMRAHAAAETPVPSGHRVEWGGQFENFEREEASRLDSVRRDLLLQNVDRIAHVAGRVVELAERRRDLTRALVQLRHRGIDLTRAVRLVLHPDAD